MPEQPIDSITCIILLPIYYNPDEHGKRKKVEENKFEITCREITEMMAQRYGVGGCTLDPVPKKGFWGQSGIVVEDEVLAVEIDNVPDTAEDEEWLIQYARDVLLSRFKQEAILIKFVVIGSIHIVYAGR